MILFIIEIVATMIGLIYFVDYTIKQNNWSKQFKEAHRSSREQQSKRSLAEYKEQDSKVGPSSHGKDNLSDWHIHHHSHDEFRTINLAAHTTEENIKNRRLTHTVNSDKGKAFNKPTLTNNCTNSSQYDSPENSLSTSDTLFDQNGEIQTLYQLNSVSNREKRHVTSQLKTVPAHSSSAVVSQDEYGQAANISAQAIKESMSKALVTTNSRKGSVSYQLYDDNSDQMNKVKEAVIDRLMQNSSRYKGKNS